MSGRTKREEIAVESMTPAAREQLLKRSQYGPKGKRQGRSPAKVVWIDGIRFASKGEGQRWQELKIQQAEGAISDLSAHPRFVIDEAFVDPRDGTVYEPLYYTADYMYRRPLQAGDRVVWRWVVEDFKGWKGLDRSYSLRKRLFRRKYPQYVFVETRQGGRRRKVRNPARRRRAA